jgi:para-nitrobenzyl esterase
MNKNEKTLVGVAGGKLEGSYRDGLYIFKGVPYAAPPVGERRWLPPQPVEPWPGVRPAVEFGTIAPQHPMMDDMEGQVAEPQAEDCLFLNIWTPGTDGARRPVMVWIHGGAFAGGSGSQVAYDGSRLAARGDAVIVTINYRLGVLGFLNLNIVTGGEIPATGNEGLLDQAAALRWVKDNIAAFGGDPGNITVFGESAGAMGIACLMVMPAARGCFHKAILQSGAGSMMLSLDQAVEVSARLLETIGDSHDYARTLRSLTAEQLLDYEMQMKLAMAGPGGVPRESVTSPVIDGEVIPDLPLQLARQGLAKDIPAIIGTNLDEWQMFAMMRTGGSEIDEAKVIRRLGRVVSAEDAASIVAAYREARAGRGEDASPAAVLSALNTDMMFRLPALDLIGAQRDNGQAAYNYLFTWKSPMWDGSLGACHGLEIGFVFGNRDDKLCGTGPAADRLAECLQDAWLAFARRGDPSGGSAGRWPVYGQDRLTMLLGERCGVKAAPYEEERRVWDGVPRRQIMP